MIRKGGLVGAALRPCKQRCLQVKVSCTLPADINPQLGHKTGEGHPAWCSDVTSAYRAHMSTRVTSQLGRLQMTCYLLGNAMLPCVESGD